MREFFPWLRLELILLRAIGCQSLSFSALVAVANDYNFKGAPQNIRAISLVLQMENPRPREVKLLGHGHIASEIPEIHRVSM